METNTLEKPPTDEKKVYPPYDIENDLVKELNEKAKQEGIIYPDSLLKYMDNGLRDNKVTPEELSKRYDEVNTHHKNRGLVWEDKEEKTEKGTVAVLKDVTGKPQACIIERTNSKDQSVFYVPTQFKKLIDDEGNISSKTVNPDFTSSSIEKIKQGLDKMEVTRSSNQVAHSINLDIKEKAQQKETPAPSPGDNDLPF